MNAFVSDRYGGPEMMRLEDVANPAAGDGEVLVKVHAISVNPADWHLLRGSPLMMRAAMGLFRPKQKIIGADIAGTVEAIGKGVTRLKPGDEVIGDLSAGRFGGFAEYVAGKEDLFVAKPANLSFAEAAAIPLAGITALQGVLKHGPIRAGQTVLVNGASGGVGHFAVQIAKSFGAEVTGVTSTKNIDLVRSFGADHVIDYRDEDFAQEGESWDLIIETVGNKSLREIRHALAPNGKATVIGFKTMPRVLAVSLFGGKRVSMMTAKATMPDLETLAKLAEAGSLKPNIDKTYPFAELPAAIAYLEEGHVRGKVVVKVV